MYVFNLFIEYVCNLCLPSLCFRLSLSSLFHIFCLPSLCLSKSYRVCVLLFLTEFRSFQVLPSLVFDFGYRVCVQVSAYRVCFHNVCLPSLSLNPSLPSLVSHFGYRVCFPWFVFIEFPNQIHPIEYLVDTRYQFFSFLSFCFCQVY